MEGLEELNTEGLREDNLKIRVSDPFGFYGDRERVLHSFKPNKQNHSLPLSLLQSSLRLESPSMFLLFLILTLGGKVGSKEFLRLSPLTYGR